MILEPIQTGKSIDYPTLKKGLQDLNKSITFDDGCGYTIYMMREGSMRAGIHYNTKMVAAVERSVMQEFTVFDGNDRFEVPCSMDEFFAADKEDPDYYCLEVIVDPNKDPLRFSILSQWIGLDGAKVLSNKKGADTSVIRMPDGCIIVATPMKIVELPCSVLHIGWRQVFERLIDARIPGITKETLGKKFNVDMTAPYNSDLQITLATHGLPTIG